jgi:hypothetical protein
MKTKSSFLLSALLLPLAAAVPREGIYTVAADSIDAGGERATTASYANQGVLGGIGAVATGAAGGASARHGYLGQLFGIVDFTLPDDARFLPEGASNRLALTAILDDDSTIAVDPAEADWSVISGPIGAIAADGRLSVQNVYENTLASVQVSFLGGTAELQLTVRNVDDDDFGSYAGDTLADDWQVRYFGLNNPNAGPDRDPDGDGQDNAFEHTAGLIPNDPQSRFRLRLENVPGQPRHKQIIFSPRLSSRDYQVEFRDDAVGGAFAPLPAPDTNDSGVERTVSDRQATVPARFYRVRIAAP